VAIVLRLVQRFQPSKRQQFLALEKQFAQLEHRGILPKGERMLSLAGRDPGNTLVWQRKFENLAAAQEYLKRAEADPEHAALFNQQAPLFGDTWVEFYEVIE
jgi:hypothetical protein